MITIAIINQSTVLKDEQLTPVCDAMQTQISRDFFPFWHVNAQIAQVCKKPDPKRRLIDQQAAASIAHGVPVTPVPQTAVPPLHSWWMIVANTSDFAGAAGYHDTTPEGLPLGKTFVKAEIDAGRPWTTTLSHELLEMLADPDISQCVEYSGSIKRIFFALEVCDPCQDDQFGYSIGQVLVSDFVLPGWFHNYRNYPFYDFAKRTKKPLEVLKGGYISVFDQGRWREVGPPPGTLTTAGVVQSALPTAPKARARVGSRRERRSLARVQWQPSNLPFDFLACDGCGCQVILPKPQPNTTVLNAKCADCLAKETTKR